MATWATPARGGVGASIWARRVGARIVRATMARRRAGLRRPLARDLGMWGIPCLMMERPWEFSLTVVMDAKGEGEFVAAMFRGASADLPPSPILRSKDLKI